MGTEVLRPQDCLVERIRSSPSCSGFVPRRKSYNHHHYYYNSNNQGDGFNYNFTPKINRKQPGVRSDHQRKPQPTRRFDPTLSRRSSSVDDLKLSRNGRGGDDHLTVLRRVESLEKISTAGKPDLLYAGSAFAVSPSPSSLPLPSFSKTAKNSRDVDDSATRDLRRLLRIDI